MNKMGKKILERFGMQIGQKVTLVAEVKEELTLRYENSKGMSGVDPADINDCFMVKHFEGSNVWAVSENDVNYFLNHNRFKSYIEVNL